MIKKIVKVFGALLFFALFSAIISVATIRFLMPWLSSKDSLNRFEIFKKANEEVTIINKTEQITVKESYSVTKTAENVLPSVVSVITFDKAEGDNVGIIKSSKDIQENIKTGVILTSDGVVVSILDDVLKKDVQNKIEEESRIKILGEGGKEYDAKLWAVDDYSGLVFYKIDATNLPVPPFGNSDELHSGEKIVFCGNTTGEYQNTFSLGVIEKKDWTFSSIGSDLSSSEKMEGAIIADTGIGYANVGGAVVDYNGTLVGIANQIEKDNKDIGFIVPIIKVKEILEKIIKEGKLERASLGVYYLSVDREIALLNNLPVNRGALIYSFAGQQGLAVLKNSSADKAGLKLGDIVIEVGEEKINLQKPLSAMIAKHKPGDEIEMKILRDGKEMILKAVLD